MTGAGIDAAESRPRPYPADGPPRDCACCGVGFRPIFEHNNLCSECLPITVALDQAKDSLAHAGLSKPDASAIAMLAAGILITDKLDDIGDALGDIEQRLRPPE